MAGATFGSMGLLVVVLAFSCRGAAAADAETNPWRNEDGTLAGGTTVTRSALPENETGFDDGLVISYRAMGNRALRVAPRDEFNRFAGSTGMLDRGIDSADVKWRRHNRF